VYGVGFGEGAGRRVQSVELLMREMYFSSLFFSFVPRVSRNLCCGVEYGEGVGCRVWSVGGCRVCAVRKNTLSSYTSILGDI